MVRYDDAMFWEELSTTIIATRRNCSRNRWDGVFAYWYNHIKILLANCQRGQGEEYERLKGGSHHPTQEAVNVLASPSHPSDSQRETARVAHAVLPHGSLYLQMRDTLGTLY